MNAIKSLKRSRDYRAKEDANPKIIEADDLIFVEVRGQWVEARQTYRQAKAAGRAASKAADDGDALFDRTGRTWVRSVTDEEGRSLSGELAKLMDGTTPGKLFFLPYRQELTAADLLETALPRYPHLQGEAEKHADFSAAIVAFHPLVTADEAATREFATKGTVFTMATAAFDRAYGKLVRNLHTFLSDEEIYAILPRFIRKGTGGGGGGGGGGTGGSGGSDT